jgi:uncharacterized membrane protein (UPF0127 family)
MRIVNLAKAVVLAENASFARRLFQRLKGLLGKKAFAPGEALVLIPCNAVHTFFMRFPIGVLFVDSHKRVVKVIPLLKPNRLSGLCLQAALVIEFPAQTISAASVAIGDQLSFEE